MAVVSAILFTCAVIPAEVHSLKLDVRWALGPITVYYRYYYSRNDFILMSATNCMFDLTSAAQ